MWENKRPVSPICHTQEITLIGGTTINILSVSAESSPYVRASEFGDIVLPLAKEPYGLATNL
jgi:hypothetical protein